MGMLSSLFITTINGLNNTVVTIGDFSFSVLEMVIASIVLSVVGYAINLFLHIND